VSMADGDNGEATPDEFHEMSDLLAAVARVSARARDKSLYTVYFALPKRSLPSYHFLATNLIFFQSNVRKLD